MEIGILFFYDTPKKVSQVAAFTSSKYIKTKIKMYGDRVNLNCKKVPTENASYKWLSLIMLDPVIRANTIGRV